MSIPLHVLILEDRPADAELMLHELRRAGFEPVWERVETEADYLSRLDPALDLILADYSLPQFDGLRALQRLQERGLDIPFIIVSGTIGEDLAVAAMREGAADYLLKDRLARLGPAVAHALEGKRLRDERQKADEALRESERRFRALIENSQDVITLIDAGGKYLYDSPSITRVMGYAPEERVGHSISEFIHPDERQAFMERFARFVQQPGAVMTSQGRFRHKDGSWRWMEGIRANLLAEPGVQAIVVNYRDVTARKRAEEQVQRQLQRLSALRDIDMAITASLDLHVTFNVILDQATPQLGVDAADILLFNPHTQTLEYTAGRGFRSRALRHTILRLGEGYAGQAALERRIVRIPNIAEAEDGLRHSPLLPSEEFIAYYAVPLIAKGQVKGVLEIFHRAPLDPDPEWLDFLQTLAGQTAIAIDNATLFDDLQRSNVELTLAYDTTLEGWAKALELRDYETEGHTQRVTELALNLARVMGMSEAELVHVRRGALLHDMGKMGIPDSILLKPGKLTEEEWEIMRRHPVYAYELLLPIAYLRPALDIPYCHHEKWDGTGYPQGLKGESISLAARIFALVDVWDALCSDRPYRKAWSEEKALAHIREQAGKHFDPKVVEVFLELLRGNESTRD